MKISFEKLTTLELDALKEVGNIGAAHAATALGQIVNKKISIGVSTIEILPVDQVSGLVGGVDSDVVVIQLRVLGDIVGGILLALKREDALALVDMLKDRPTGTTKMMDEIDRSALKESGSILSASYLLAIGKFLKLSLIPSVPNYLDGVMGEIVKETLQKLMKISPVAFCIETEFVESARKINGHFLLLPDVNSLELILKALGFNE